MTKKEAIRQTEQERALMELGFTAQEAEQLRRISITLHRWFERECGDGNGCIERDETTNKPYWLDSMTGRRYPIPDRETGARKRLDAIVGTRNARIKPAEGDNYIAPLSAYIQTDPRGAALYIIRPGDVPDGADVDAYYPRGICVY